MKTELITGSDNSVDEHEILYVVDSKVGFSNIVISIYTSNQTFYYITDEGQI